MSTFYVAANWKMNKTPAETLEFIKNWKSQFAPQAGRQVLFFPSYLSLPVFQKELADTSSAYGAQNCYHQDAGAFTGEISVSMLQAYGCTYCLVGHSERRTLFKESDEDIALKALALQKKEITPLVCIGETEYERNQGQTLAVVERQLLAVLQKVEQSQPLLVAYEPVWSIGTGKVPTLLEIAEVHTFLRNKLVEKLGLVGNTIPLLYGGSVNAKNAKDIQSVESVNGFLIGGASLQAASLLDIYKGGA